MKVSTIVMAVLMVAFIFMTVGLIVNDFQTQYADTPVDTSWSSKYDYSAEINTSAESIKNSFSKIGEEKGGWKIFTAITAIPNALIETVNIVLLSLTSGISIMTGISTDIGIPPQIIGFGVIAIIILIVFALVKFWRKEETSV